MNYLSLHVVGALPGAEASMNRLNGLKIVAPVFLLVTLVAGTPAFAQTPGIDFSGEWTDWEMLGENDPRYQEVGDIVQHPV